MAQGITKLYNIKQPVKLNFLLSSEVTDMKHYSGIVYNFWLSLERRQDIKWIQLAQVVSVGEFF